MSIQILYQENQWTRFLRYNLSLYLQKFSICFNMICNVLLVSVPPFRKYRTISVILMFFYIFEPQHYWFGMSMCSCKNVAFLRVEMLKWTILRTDKHVIYLTFEWDIIIFNNWDNHKIFILNFNFRVNTHYKNLLETC